MLRHIPSLFLNQESGIFLFTPSVYSCGILSGKISS